MKRLTPRQILIGAWTVFVLFGYPGYMRAEALDELVDSRTGTFTDWHSPMLTEVWRVLGRVISGPAPLFLLQGGLLLGGSYALLRRVIPERKAAFAAACVLLFPPLLATTSLVSDDATLAAFLIAGAAMLLAARSELRLGGVVILIAAAGMREGAGIAVLPIVLGALRSPRNPSGWRQRMAAIGVGLAIVGLGHGLSYRLVEEHTGRRDSALAMVDIAGTLEHAPSRDDATILIELPGVAFAGTTKIQGRARQVPADRLDHGEHRLFEPADSAERRAALIEGRCKLSRTLPIAYLNHRAHVLLHVLGFGRSKRWLPFLSEFVPSPNQRLGVAHAAHHSLAQRILIWPVRVLSHTVLFRPYVYFFLAIVLVPVALIRKHGLAAMLLVSGIGYELALGIVAASPNYRDSHWMMVATVLAFFAIVVRELEARHERVGEQAPVAVTHDKGV